jgi:SPP1 family predicted phage head-tail adaptor
MDAGALNRRITIQKAVTASNSVGEDINTFSPVATVWAAPRAILLREATRLAGLSQSAEIKFEIRYRAGLDTGMALDYQGKQYEITSVEETPDRSGLLLFARSSTW